MNDVSAASAVDSVLSSVPTPAPVGASARTGFERP
jgi:MoxR-like ATPase